MENSKYEFSDNTTPLLGCSFYIVNPYLAEIAQEPREIRTIGTRVLISMGGSDPENLTPDVVRGLLKLIRHDLKVKIVIGTCFAENLIEELRRIVKGVRGTYEFCFNSNVPELMFWSDLVITGIGLTRYEASLTGTPNICLTRENLDKHRNDKFISAGTSLYLSIPDNTQFYCIAEETERLLGNFERREKMSMAGKALIDGNGSERIINELKKDLLI